MIRTVIRSLFVVCVLASVGLAETPAATPAPATAHVAKKHAHKTKRKARKAKHRHHKAKKHAAAK